MSPMECTTALLRQQNTTNDSWSALCSSVYNAGDWNSQCIAFRKAILHAKHMGLCACDKMCCVQMHGAVRAQRALITGDISQHVRKYMVPDTSRAKAIVCFQKAVGGTLRLLPTSCKVLCADNYVAFTLAPRRDFDNLHTGRVQPEVCCATP